MAVSGTGAALTSADDPTKKQRWAATSSGSGESGSGSYDSADEYGGVDPALIAKTKEKQDAKEKDTAAGYHEASSWGRSSQASQAFLESIRKQQAGIQQAGAASSAGYQQSQLLGAQQLQGYGTKLGNQASDYGQRFDARSQAEMIDRQGAASDYLNRVARGEAPSVAQAQMRQGQDAALAAQLAVAGTGRGGSAGAALDQALRQNAATQQQMAAQGATMRAQESLSATQAAASIDAARQAQMAQGAGIGLQASTLQGQAVQNALAARSGAYSGASDIDLAYRGLDRSYEDLVYGQGNEEANRELGAMTGQSALSNQRTMQERQFERDDQAAWLNLGGSVATSVAASQS